MRGRLERKDRFVSGPQASQAMLGAAKKAQELKKQFTANQPMTAHIDLYKSEINTMEL